MRVLIILLTTYYLLLTAPSALAQVTSCSSGQTACPQSCTYGVDCVSCWSAPTCTISGQTASTCGACQCPSGQVVCGSACQTPAATQGQSCDAGSGPGSGTYNQCGVCQAAGARYVSRQYAFPGVEEEGYINVQGNVRSNTLCIGEDCRTAWPAAAGGTVNWSQLAGFPASCPVGQYAFAVGGTVSCSATGLLIGGTSGRVAFWTGSSILGQSVNLQWNDPLRRLGIGIAPSYALHIVGDRIYVNNLYGNAELNLKSGTAGVSDTQQWGIYSDDASNELRFWRDDNRLAITATGDVLIPGRIGIGVSAPTQKLTVSGIIESTGGGFKFPDGTTQTTAATAGAAYDPCGKNVLVDSGAGAPFTNGVPTGNLGGYIGAKATCAGKFTGSHLCTAEEILHTINCGVITPGSGSGWISAGPPGHTSLANDCQGWTDSTSTALGRKWSFNAAGGYGLQLPCDSPNISLICCI